MARGEAFFEYGAMTYRVHLTSRQGISAFTAG